MKRWKNTAIYTLVISLFVTAFLFITYLNRFAFIMSEQQWKSFNQSEYFKWIGLVIALAWNGVIIKMFYDRLFDHSKEKAYRDYLKNNKVAL